MLINTNIHRVIRIKHLKPFKLESNTYASKIIIVFENYNGSKTEITITLFSNDKINLTIL